MSEPTKSHKICERLLYTEASEACRNYSRLTMQVRTLSQQVLIGAVIALSVATLGQEIPATGISGTTKKFFGYVFLTGGAILGCFSIALALVDWHYQSAFTAIRNALVYMEGTQVGSWRTHAKVRSSQNDFIASYFPFWSLWFIGLIGYLVGLTLTFGQPPIFTYGSGAIFVVGIVAFLYIFLHQGDINIEKELIGQHKIANKATGANHITLPKI